MLIFLTFLVKAPTTIGISIPGIVAVVFDIPYRIPAYLILKNKYEIYMKAKYFTKKQIQHVK